MLFDEFLLLEVKVYKPAPSTRLINRSQTEILGNLTERKKKKNQFAIYLHK